MIRGPAGSRLTSSSGFACKTGIGSVHGHGVKRQGERLQSGAEKQKSEGRDELSSFGLLSVRNGYLRAQNEEIPKS